jgi:YD repeat-containing protein
LPSSKTFVSSYNYPGGIPAVQTTIINGTLDAMDGISNKTTVEISVEDQFGHTVSQSVHVSDGQGGTLGLITRATHEYTDGWLTATYRDGRLNYQCSYNAEGLVEWEEDQAGQRTEFVYDEMRRISNRTIKGRGGDVDRVFNSEYDVHGNKISETVTAGSLISQTKWIYDLTGDLTAVITPDGLTNTTDTVYNGTKTVSETHGSQATQVTSYFKDRTPRSVTGTATEDRFMTNSSRLGSLVLIAKRSRFIVIAG